MRFVVLVLSLIVGVGGHVRAGDVTANVSADVSADIGNFPDYARIESDEQLAIEFPAYMKWLADLGVRDAVMVYRWMQDGTLSLDAVTAIFHEKVELAAWKKLGHKLKDIMTLEYYQKHYETTYPKAHREAMFSELGLTAHFAAAKGVKNIPQLAYVLVHPLVEHHGVPVAKMVGRLKFNSEYLDARVTTQHLKDAMRVFEMGGHQYKDAASILKQAQQVIGVQASGPVVSITGWGGLGL